MSDIIQEAKHLPLAYELPDRVVEVIESLAAQLAAAQSRLAEIEAQEPVSAVPVGVAMNAIAHVGSANYQHRQDEAEGWVESAAFRAYARPVPPAAQIPPQDSGDCGACRMNNKENQIHLKLPGESFWGYQYPDLPKNQAEINNHLVTTDKYAFGDRVEFDEEHNVTKLIMTREEVTKEIALKKEVEPNG